MVRRIRLVLLATWPSSCQWCFRKTSSPSSTQWIQAVCNCGSISTGGGKEVRVLSTRTLFRSELFVLVLCSFFSFFWCFLGFSFFFSVVFLFFSLFFYWCFLVFFSNFFVDTGEIPHRPLKASIGWSWASWAPVRPYLWTSFWWHPSRYRVPWGWGCRLEPMFVMHTITNVVTWQRHWWWIQAKDGRFHDQTLSHRAVKTDEEHWKVVAR